jgi:5-methyltetrahydropteroyltriglutamate--homocysteine methyltransferase
MSFIVTNLGFPRIGPRRELKTALESFWAGKTDKTALLETAAALRAATWARQKALGVDIIPSNDFSFYDSVLDTSVMVGAIPTLYRGLGAADSLEVYFAMARGTQTGASEASCTHGHGKGGDVPALEMTKWFDTNYHYMVPEVAANQSFQLTSNKVIEEFQEAKALGYHTRPVILGPVTWLLLAKSKQTDCPFTPSCYASCVMLGRIGYRSTSLHWYSI